MASWTSATALTSVTTMQEGEEINGGNFMSNLNIEENDRADGAVSSNAGDLLEEIREENSNIKNEECDLCKKKLCSPRILSCLHVFCESCLDKQLIHDRNNPTGDSIIICSECDQQTIVGPKGAASLPCDYVLTNILDMSAIENMTVICTSCKNQESAIARCSDCANFLCPNCNTAHQYMRCFENHKVIAFEDLKQSNKTVPIHKPIFCELHPAENMKFYCYTCQELICNECLLVEHKAPEHQYERLSVAEGCQINELFSLMSESKSKISECEQASVQLENAFSELQSQHDHAKSLIIETFQNYETILEKCRDNALKHLEQLRSEREFQVMNTFHIVDKIKAKMQDANRFTSRLLKHGDTTEILALKRFVSTQLINLINNTPKPNIRPSIEFQTDHSHFNTVINECFGKFKSESIPSVMTSSETITTTTAVTSQQTMPMPCPNSSDSSMSTTASSFEGDSFIILPKLNPRNVRPSLFPASLPLDPMHGFTNTQEHNLQQLAGFTEKEDFNDSIVVEAGSNPSPNASFAMPDLHSGEFTINCSSYMMKNFHGPAKPEVLRNNSLVNREIPTSNGGENLVLRRASSPVINDLPNLGSLSMNTPVNGGFQSLPKPNDHKSESMHIMQRIVANSVAKVPGSEASNYTHPRSSDTKLLPMQIRAKFGQLGPAKGQFNSPHGFCLGTDEDIVVADTNNHRIQIFDKTGQLKSMFGFPGKEEGQLWYPRKVAVMKNCGKFVVCDRGNERSRMQLFTKNGHFIKKIAIRYIDIVAGLAVTSQGHIVAVDSVSPTVFIISENGSLLKWFDCGDYMREPSDIAISDTEYYVCDFKGHCVVVFNEDGQFLRRIGCENRTNFPNGIDISDAGDVLIGDSHGNRFHVSVYSPEGTLLSEFECPHVKVSRCCGLKITSEGYVVTLAKNNHHVLVLNTLYIL